MFPSIAGDILNITYPRIALHCMVYELATFEQQLAVRYFLRYGKTIVSDCIDIYLKDSYLRNI